MKTMRFRSLFVLIWVVFLSVCVTAARPILAADNCRISVATILAAHDETTIDPKLKPQIIELQSMFNYTSYRLLGSEHLTLASGQSGSVSLPGEHILGITLQQIRGDRSTMVMRMSKNERSVFDTRIQLLNNGDLFIGGPKYLNGNLIFKISGAF